jgi:hypothetical protein
MNAALAAHTTTATLALIPGEETVFAALPDAARADVRLRYKAVQSILDLRKENAPRVRLTQTAEYHARLLVISVKRLRNLVSEYVESGYNWRTLVDTNRWKISEGTELLPADFLREWKRRCERHPGGIKAAHRELILQWKAWRRGDATKAIPGYDFAPLPRNGSDEPAGWSYNNLLEHKPSRAELLIVRRGLGGARSMLPQVLTSRRELLVGQRIEFDDYEPDLRCIFGNGSRIIHCKPLQLAALDVHSGCVPMARFKPSYERADDVTDKWKKAHALLFTAAYLANHGYDQQHGTVLVVEGGTFTLDASIVELIHEMTGGKVRVEFPPDRSRRQVAPFRGKSGGNPNKKPHLESWHNLLTRSLANQPGHKGSHYLKEPEYLAGQLAEADKLIKLAADLGPERAAHLDFPLLDFTTGFLPRANACIDQLNLSHDHDLEGWEALGYYALAYRLHAGSDVALAEQDLLALPPLERNEILALAQRDPAAMVVRRKLSRWDVWDRQQREAQANGRIKRLPGYLACELIAADGKAAEAVHAIRPRSLTRAYITVEDTRLALLDGPQIYEARVLRPDGTVCELPEGDYKIVFNAFAPETIFVKDTKDRFLGIAPRAERINPNDQAAVLEAYGHAGSRRAERLQPVRERHADWHNEVARRGAHNTRVANGAPITDEEKAEARALTRRVRNVTSADRESLLSTPCEPTSDSRPPTSDSRPPAPDLSSIL